MQVRDRLHRLIDELPEDELGAVERLLVDRRQGCSPLRRAVMDAPVDDEPLSADDFAALEEAYADVAAGRFADDETLWRRLGDDPTR